MGIRLAMVCDIATTISEKKSGTLVTVPAPNVVAVDVFGTSTFRRHLLS